MNTYIKLSGPVTTVSELISLLEEHKGRELRIDGLSGITSIVEVGISGVDGSLILEISNPSGGW